MMKKQLLILCSCIGFLFTGCQQISKTPALSMTQPENVEQFKITGKIGVRTPQQNGSAFYGWTQIGDQFAIDLTGALGVGQTSIRGKPGDVSLTSSKTGTIEATTPEELLFKATGWQAPITHLVAWINAKTATAQAEQQTDAQGRLSTVHEGGWTANLSYNNQEKQPSKLVLVDDAQQNRVTLTIQTRE
ncbi:outer membrane lipoprotein LolB [Acinetobacter qingfengensis]|uniref:Outer-membrane lipoprotein LolB n=2 Tax=Acinetobacter qingfengensis TaxID=1262585 RepID=A0A1E7RFR3_9GAMM|nr:lipoprotein insertase outer membrane protein LolB [Acinetobacter qingfengensis]KAA8732812.1 outer membrane lipoprotein LolB [Acinetobacter qingfengensis]OEY98077.1 outer membrane lipoprotein LolB [Acinetobacter qingfengensis]